MEKQTWALVIQKGADQGENVMIVKLTKVVSICSCPFDLVIMLYFYFTYWQRNKLDGSWIFKSKFEEQRIICINMS